MNDNDMMKEYNTMDKMEEDAQQTTIKIEECTTMKKVHPASQATQATKIHLHYPQVLKSSIQATVISHPQFQG
jgi:hypothetical protein